MTIEEEVRSLVNELKSANSAYYDFDAPIMGDNDYDRKMRRLRDLETEHPECILPDTPTKYVGGNISKTLEKVKHVKPMLSLLDVWDDEEVKSFVLLAQDENPNVEFDIEPKVDGLSIELVYENGELTRASTRGNGDIGEDVTDNARMIKNLPMYINVSGRVVFRGEAYIDLDTFDDINRALIDSGERPFATPRNTAAGTLRNANPNVVKARKLRYVIFQVVESPVEFSSHSKALKWAASLGFDTFNSYPVHSYNVVLEQINAVHNMIWPFPIDGVAVKVDDYKTREVLGDTNKYPKWAVARKFESETAPTIVKDIVVQIGRTGVLTPVAKIKKVIIDGTAIQSVTLNNAACLEETDIRVGDTVLVTKAGGIIPRIVGVMLNKRPALSRRFEFPETCPECGSDIVKDGASLRCTGPMCPAQLARRIVHFCGEGAFDIQGIGPAVANELSKTKLISNPAELFTLDAMDWLNATSLLSASDISKLQNQLAKRKLVSLSNYIYALGIPNVGRVASHELGKRYHSIEEIAQADILDLAKTASVGELTAKKIHEFLNRADISEMLALLEQEGVRAFNTSISYGSPIEYNTFCFTGTLRSMSRAEACRNVESRNGYTTNRVIADGYLVVGENPSEAKIERARKLDVYIINEDEFVEMLF